MLKKSEIKVFLNSYKNKISKLLKITLIDTNRDEISAIFYDEQAEYYDEFIEEGKIYGFCKGTIKEAKPEYNRYFFGDL